MKGTLLLLGLLVGAFGTKLHPCTVAPQTRNTEVVITYECLRGFIPIGGATTARCSGSGSFTPTQALRCGKPCGTPPAIPNASIVSSDPVLTTPSVNRKVTYRCNRGFIAVSGSPTLTCSNGGPFQGSRLVCRKPCGTPPSIPNASIVSSDPALNILSVNRKVTYRCNRGFIAVSGSPTLTCSNGGPFQGSRLVCRKPCGTPPSIPNASIVSSSPALTTPSVNRDVTYKCNEGFAAVGGQPTLKCRNGGPFQGKQLVCQRVCKKDIKVPSGVRVIYSQGQARVAYFKCLNRSHWIDPKYKIHFAKCINGVWANGPDFKYRPYRAPKCVRRLYH